MERESESQNRRVPIEGPLRLLLLEDHVVTRNAMSRLLVLEGHVVETAATIHDAKILLESNQWFDLIISDLGLPDGTGIEFLSWMTSKWPEIPAIAITALSSDADRKKISDAGFRAHITKPVSFDALTSAVKRHATRQRS